jgi:hypothetical protein
MEEQIMRSLNKALLGAGIGAAVFRALRHERIGCRCLHRQHLLAR